MAGPTRGKPFHPHPVRDEEVTGRDVTKVQQLVKDTFDQLEDHRRGMLVSTVLPVAAGGALLSEQLTVVYTGKGGDTITLPPAALRGTGRGQVLCVANQGTGAVTVIASGKDTINGVAGVPVNATAVLFADGAAKWHAVQGIWTLPNVGPGAGLIGGAGLASITLDAQGRVTAVVTASYVVTTRNLISTADITLDGSASATKDLTADRTVGLANAGAGAATYGATGVTSITLDAKGRVTGTTVAALVAATRSLISTADITLDAVVSNTVDLSANRTIGLANAGLGAGGTGSHSAIPVTITLDAKGRVTGVTTQTADISIGAHDLIHRRTVLSQGTALVAGDFAISAGWGTTATKTVGANSRDSGGNITIGSAGTGQAANPTITLTFKDGAFGAAPRALVVRNGGVTLASVPTWTTTTTTLVITFNGTPVAANNYGFEWLVVGGT
jgi:hypothetical protein